MHATDTKVGRDCHVSQHHWGCTPSQCLRVHVSDNRVGRGWPCLAASVMISRPRWGCTLPPKSKCTHSPTKIGSLPCLPRLCMFDRTPTSVCLLNVYYSPPTCSVSHLYAMLCLPRVCTHNFTCSVSHPTCRVSHFYALTPHKFCPSIFGCLLQFHIWVKCCIVGAYSDGVEVGKQVPGSLL